MVVSYDDVQPKLDELEVKDKRSQSKTTESSSDTSTNVQNDSNSNGGSPTHNLNEREKIYQRGTDGLKEIKQSRLENWLGTSEGVGSQTEQRVLMVFERNESVHRNPHVLYNLLDDELKASASYLNTMVQDIFAPEEEHGDLLQSQGYTPYYNRGATQQSQQASGGFGGPMNATGSTGFSPGNNQPNQQNQQPQQNTQPQSRQPRSESEAQSSQAPSTSNEDVMTRDEAEMMMSQAVNQANTENQRNALLSGLSDATDEALQEMATNVGGLAGTIQKVVDEALVGYARENPEWVIENMDILQKVLGATEDMPGDGQDQASGQSNHDQKVDNALENLSGSTTSSSTPTVAQESRNIEEQTEAQANPDLNEEHMKESGFDPSEPPSNDTSDIDNSPPENKPTPGGETEQKSEKTKQEFESEEDNEDENKDSFDEIFGDLQ
jgi:hypothetical protein